MPAAAEGLPVEVVVAVDGGDAAPEPALRALAAAGRCRLVEAPAAGGAATRNAALREAAAAWVCVLDDDDRLAPGALARLRARADGDAEAVGVAGRVEGFREAGGPPIALGTLPDTDAIGFDDLVIGDPVVSLGSALLRTDAVRAAGGFDASLRIVEDWDLLLKLCRGRRLRLEPSVTLHYRLHAGNGSVSDPSETLRQSLRLLKRHARDEPAAVRAAAAVNLMRWVGRPVFRGVHERMARLACEGLDADWILLARLYAFGGRDPRLLRLAGETLTRPRPAPGQERRAPRAVPGPPAAQA